MHMYDNNLKPVIAAILYSYNHGLVVAEYTIQSVFYYEFTKTRLINTYCFVKSFVTANGVKWTTSKSVFHKHNHVIQHCTKYYTQ